jgi:hypothetical protein
MLIVYLDKNVLDHVLTVRRTGVETNRVTSADVQKLQRAVREGRIRNLMSAMQIQEAAYALNAPSEKVAQEELAGIRELLYQDEVIKFPRDLLFDDISNYAKGNGPAGALMRNTLDLDGLFSPKGDIKERKQALADTTRQGAAFLETAKKANDHDREIVLRDFNNAQPKFGEFYEARIVPKLKGLVQSAERHSGQNGLLAGCEKRGIEGMLEFRT